MHCDAQPQHDDSPIVAANINVVDAIYSAAMLEEAKLFQVVDRLVELFAQGQLPLEHGRAAKLLQSLWKSGQERLSAKERENLYGEALGIPGGTGVITPNRAFTQLWLRFVTAVANFGAQGPIGSAAHDLAVNLTRAGWGKALLAAPVLRAQVSDLVTILADPEIRTAFGARDMWQVVDRVAELELGGAVKTRCYVTMAVSGSVIFAWLARHSSDLAGGTVCSADLRVMDASERWLGAAASTAETATQHFSPAA